MAGSAIIRPGQQIRPRVDENLAVKIVESNYDLKVLSLTQLDSFDDKNFRVLCKFSNETVSKTGYVLKILNVLDSENEEFIDCQTKLLLFLQQKGIKSSIPQKLSNGSWHKVENIDGKNHVVRLLSFYPGKILNQLSSVSDKLLFNLGSFAAKLDAILLEFHHPSFDNNVCFWSAESITQLHNFTFAMEDPSELSLVESILSVYEREVVPQLDTLEQGIIHADISATNVIVDEKGENVEAIIDFGICHRSSLIFELGSLICYMIVKCRSLEVGKVIIEGYQTQRALSDLEKKLLKMFVCARFIQTVIMNCYSNKVQPSNKTAMMDLDVKKNMLKKLWPMKESDVFKMWGLMM